VVIVMGHNRINRETRVILDHCTAVGVPMILGTDTLGEALRDEVAVGPVRTDEPARHVDAARPPC